MEETTLITSDKATIPHFGLIDWWKFYKIKLSPDLVVKVANFPWSEKMLDSPCPFNPGKTIRETHFAFVGLDAITIMELQKLNPKETEPRFYSYAPGAWYSNQKFATTESLKFRWYLLLKDIIPNSENKTFDEQKAMLPKEYEVPSAVEETAKDFLIYKKTGIYANPDRHARTNDTDLFLEHIRVGLCNAASISVFNLWDGYRNKVTGLSASRKLPS